MSWRRLNGWLVIVSLVVVPVSYVLRNSVAYVVLLSHLALTLGFLAAWRADSDDE